MKTSYLFLLCMLISVSTLFTQEDISNLSDEQKIFGLSKVWKEADKNFVYFDQIPEVNWDSVYTSYILKVLSTESDYSYFKELQKFCSLLKDGHTRVYVPWSMRKVLEVSAPLRTELIDEKVIIVDLLNDTLRQEGLEIGMEILEVEGVPVQKYAEEKVKPYVFYSTVQDRNVQIYENHLLRGPLDKMLKIKVKSAGEEKEVKVSRRLTRERRQRGIFEFEMLDGQIGHLKIFQFWGDSFESEFDSIFQLVKKSEKLIIDVSINQGGNSGFADYVLKHFVKKSFRTSNWKTPIYKPAYASWGRDTGWEINEGYKVKPVNSFKRYNKAVVVLISEKTYSAGEDFVSAFLNTNRGKVIGRATAGTTGNPIAFELPGQGFVQICSKRDYLSTGEEFVGYGIAPQIEVEKSFGEEKLMKKALEVLNKK